MEGKCEECEEIGRLYVHHKDENHQNNAPENLQHLCPSCHGSSSDHSYKNCRKGFGYKGPPNTTCCYCGYEWKYKGKGIVATCPNCGLKTQRKKQ